MNSKLELNKQLFEKNIEAIKKTYKLNGSLETAACATAFIGDETPADPDKLMAAKKFLSKNTSIFSYHLSAL